MADSEGPYGPPPGSPYGPPPRSPYGPPPGSPPPPDQVTYGWPQPPQPEPSRGSKRKWFLVGGSVVAACAIVAGAAFGAAAVLGGNKSDLGSQPAQVLPSSTFAYASIDTDPSDGELVDLLGILAKFPGLTQHLSLSGGSADPRKMVFDAVTSDDQTGSCHLSWDTDLAPWLGTSFAVAGVPVADKPQPVVVAEVTNTAKANAEITKLQGCDHDDAFRLSGDWLLLAPHQAILDAVTSGDAAGTLADDATYQHWMGEVGNPGMVQAYVAPSAGAMLATSLGRLSKMTTAVPPSCAFASPGSSLTDMPCAGMSMEPQALARICPGLASAPGQVVSSYQAMLRGFGGAAFTMRVRDGGIEAESAADMGTGVPASTITGTGTDGAQLVTGLPADTSAAVGLSVAPNPWESIVSSFSQVCGKGTDPSKINSYLSGLTGLTFPGDIDTLLGKGLSLSVGQLDPGIANEASADPSKLPVALQFTGDANGIQTVIGKVLNKLGQSSGMPLASVIGVGANGDRVVVGPDSSYRQEVLSGGSLGSDPTFENAVPDADKASSIIYVNLDRFDSFVQSSDPTAYDDYFKPLQAVGIAGWSDPDHTAHELFRVTTQ